MAYETIRFTRDDRVATITLDRPESLNAFTPELLAEMEAATGEVAADQTLSVLIITGAGRAFCAGMDLKAALARNPDLTGGNVGDAINLPGRRLLDRLETMPQAVIAKVNGICFTGGVEALTSLWETPQSLLVRLSPTAQPPRSRCSFRNRKGLQ